MKIACLSYHTKLPRTTGFKIKDRNYFYLSSFHPIWASPLPVLWCISLSTPYSCNACYMDEGAFKDTNPLMSSLLIILFGVVKQFCRFWIWSDTDCKTSAEYGPQYISTPPQPHTVIYCTLGRGEGGGGQREGREEGQQYTSIVPSPMGATFHKLGRKYKPWLNVSPFHKIC